MRLKKVMATGLVAALALSTMVGCSSKKDSSDQKKIGVVQLVEHDALDASYKGFKDGLEKAGYKDGDKIKIEYKNSQNEQSNCQTIAKQFVTDKCDLVLAIATPAAQAMANEEKFAGKVFVVDNGRVATPMHRSVLDAVEMVEKGYSGAEIKKILEETREKMIIYIGLSTLEYLKKGGRISSMTALAANVLNIKPVMRFGTGKLDTYQKCRGMKKSCKVMIDAMKEELETNFREEYKAGKVYLMAASSSTDEVTEEWVEQIKESFPGMEVMCDKLSFGLSCHIGPDGLGIGCTCKPV